MGYKKGYALGTKDGLIWGYEQLTKNLRIFNKI